MKKIVAFSGSNSSTSINQQLVHIAAGLVEELEVEIIDLRDYPAPLYGIDLEKAEGIPATMEALKTKFSEVDGVILSSPEHNGSMPAFFKNAIDWMSRIKADTKVFANKPMLLMSTSPGKNGGRTNLNTLKNLLPWWGTQVISTFSLPGFYQNVTDGKLAAEYEAELKLAIREFEYAIIRPGQPGGLT